MIIGPFWCEVEKSWLRFVARDEGKLSAEVSKRDDKENTRTLAWTPVAADKDFWIFNNYETKDKVPVNEGLRLQDGILYHTDFIINKFKKAIIVSTYNKIGKKIPVRGNINPFSDKALIKTLNNTTYDKLPKQPLTDEELQGIANQWAQWKTEDHRKKFNPETINTFFTSAQNEALYVELERELSDVSFQSVSNYKDALKTLESAISNPADPIHTRIQNFAARTSFGEAPYLIADNITNDRVEVYKQKQLFAYAILKAERELLLKEFKVAVTPIQTVPLKVLSALTTTPAPSRVNPTPSNEEDDSLPFDPELQDVTDIDLQRALLNTSEQRPNPVVSSGPERPAHPPEPRAAIPLPATANSAPTTPGNVITPPPALSTPAALIRNAVINGINKYQRWYKQEDGAKNLRGSICFFSFTWLRHGDAGQKRAVEFKDSFKENVGEFEAIALVNALLTASTTRFHRHSLASFLLDELRAFQPWQGLSPDKASNRYDRDQVVLQLDQSKPVACK